MVPLSTSKKDTERAARKRAERALLQQQQDHFASSTARLPPSSTHMALSAPSSSSSAASIRTISETGSASSSSIHAARPYDTPSLHSSHRSNYSTSSVDLNSQMASLPPPLHQQHQQQPHQHHQHQQHQINLPPPHRLKTPAPNPISSRPLPPPSNGPAPPRPSFMQPPSNTTAPSASSSPRARPQSAIYNYPASQQPHYPSAPNQPHHHSHSYSQSQTPQPVLPPNPGPPSRNGDSPASFYRPSAYAEPSPPPHPTNPNYLPHSTIPTSASTSQQLNMAGAGAATRLDPSTGRPIDNRRQSVPVSFQPPPPPSAYASHPQPYHPPPSHQQQSYQQHDLGRVAAEASVPSSASSSSRLSWMSMGRQPEEPLYATYADGGNGNTAVGLSRELTSTRSTMRSAEKLLAVSRGLRNFFQRTPQRNEFLVRVTTIFASNLEGHVSRLVAREMELIGQESRALASISRDFDKAASWLQENEQNISHHWPTERSAKALKELDERLTKAFTSKLAVALFEAVQDNRAMSQQISRQIEGLESDLPGMIKRIVAQANSQTIETTIRRLRVEETALKPRDGGTSADSYGGGEAEKTIASLIDALETARLTQREKEERAEAAERIMNERAGRLSVSYDALDGGGRPPIAQPPVSGQQQQQQVHLPSAASARSSRTVNSTQSDTSSFYQSTLFRSPGGLNIITPSNGLKLQPLPLDNFDPPAFPRSQANLPCRDDTKPHPDDEDDSILFRPVDPISKTELLDPILASDGFIHDRFCFLAARPEHPLKPGTPLTILSDVTQLRLAIHARFPERKTECMARRSSYLVEAVRLSDEGFFSSDSQDALERLTGVLDWQGDEPDTGVLVRRAILRWRLRHLRGALEDLQYALKIAPTLPVQHWLAIVLVDLRRWSEAEEAISNHLARDSNAPLPLALRSIIHSQHGRFSEAQRDVELASSILASPPPSYNEPQTSTDSKSTYSPLANAAASTPLPILLDLNFLAAGHAWLALSEPVRASIPLARAIELGPAGEAWSRALWGFCLVQSTVDLGDGDEEEETRKEGWREMDSSWKLAADLGSTVKARGEEGEGLGDGVVKRPLRGAIGVLLAQAKAKTDPSAARSILIESFAYSHPLVPRTSDELSFLASLHAQAGEYESATRAFDEAVALASREERPEERAALMAERARLRV